ncbi:hypothetical protein AI20_12710 [Aeromonas hydrophila YL17]|nr:hypothetical protein AI20_12710 [Aeromonas hydrophila YL17]
MGSELTDGGPSRPGFAAVLTATLAAAITAVAFLISLAEQARVASGAHLHTRPLVIQSLFNQQDGKSVTRYFRASGRPFATSLCPANLAAVLASDECLWLPQPSATPGMTALWSALCN